MYNHVVCNTLIKCQGFIFAENTYRKYLTWKDLYNIYAQLSQDLPALCSLPVKEQTSSGFPWIPISVYFLIAFDEQWTAGKALWSLT